MRMTELVHRHGRTRVYAEVIVPIRAQIVPNRMTPMNYNLALFASIVAYSSYSSLVAYPCPICARQCYSENIILSSDSRMTYAICLVCYTRMRRRAKRAYECAFWGRLAMIEVAGHDVAALIVADLIEILAK